MKPILPELKDNSERPLYIQLYDYLKSEILEGQILEGEKLPSLRKLAADLGLSVTTIELAYQQLLVEGYVTSRPQSGYYVAKVAGGRGAGPGPAGSPERAQVSFENYPFEEPKFLCDLDSFDFVKWKKCMAAVLNERPDLLLYESDPQGERMLRYEISQYIYTSRGVQCSPDQIVIAAGTQQLTNHLARILRRMKIDHVATEEPGYLPVQNIFQDLGFSLTRVPVAEDGIAIEKLPVNIPCAVYVCPQNQFPTGAVMPAGRRYALLAWARENQSIILEDDYDSELRYFGRPVPALQGLDEEGTHVVYFGSFSSTLFPAIKISYMVLPPHMAEIFRSFMSSYDQTCSKCEQLTLAMFMERGYYYTSIRKMRNLYAAKLQAVLAALRKYAGDFVTPMNTRSGINIILRVRADSSQTAYRQTKHAGTPEAGAGEGAAQVIANHAEYAARLSRLAAGLSLNVAPVQGLAASDGFGDIYLSLYYNQIPLEKIDDCIRELIGSWHEK